MARFSLGTCPTCTFWREHGLKIGTGECRVNPPTLVVIHDKDLSQGASYDSQWPITDSDDWCGKYESAIVGGRRMNFVEKLNDRESST